jgi:23S rRNA (adenine2503-C2)-methyltransferase
VPSIYDLSREELTQLAGSPSYRGDQLWSGLYSNYSDIDEITTLSKPLRAHLAALPALQKALRVVHESETDNGSTVKWLCELPDGKRIETVLMYYDDRVTVCVSSQAGCAMNCSFCATGQAGYDRQLSAGEIVEQVIMAARRSRNDSRRLSHIVFMGMGEPMANYENLWPAITRIHDDIGIGARHVTVSTVGIIPGILRLAREDLPVNLAVSLHAANDELRTSLVPINKRYPIKDLMEACYTFIESHNRRLSFEWALINEVNDRESDAKELADLARPLGAHVNLIPLNPTPGYLVQGPSRNRVHRFAEYLSVAGINVTIRDTRGSDIDAACGQLAAEHAGTAVALRDNERVARRDQAE